jgi:hypothetical protein
MEQQIGVNLDVKTEDVQAVLQQDRVFALLVQNQALRRMVAELTVELGELKNGMVVQEV